MPLVSILLSVLTGLFSGRHSKLGWLEEPLEMRDSLYRPDALPVTQPTMSEHWRKNNIIDWKSRISKEIVTIYFFITLNWAEIFRIGNPFTRLINSNWVSSASTNVDFILAHGCVSTFEWLKSDSRAIWSAVCIVSRCVVQDRRMGVITTSRLEAGERFGPVPPTLTLAEPTTLIGHRTCDTPPDIHTVKVCIPRICGLIDRVQQSPYT